MAIPNVSDIRTLVPYAPPGGTQGTIPNVTRTPIVHKAPAGGISRTHYELASTPIPLGEEFIIGCDIVLKEQWGRGGTILRVENNAPTGQKLWRLEVDIFRDGFPYIVRNCHVNMGSTLEYQPLAGCTQKLPVGRKFRLELRAKLSLRDGDALSVVSVDGTEIGRTTMHNLTSNQGTPGPITRARYGIIQGSSVASTVELTAAYVTPATPPPPPVDPLDTAHDLGKQIAVAPTLAAAKALAADVLAL